MHLYLHKAAKKLGIHPKLLKADIKNGKLHLNDDGCVDCEELKVLYPDQWRAAYESEFDYWEGMRYTAKQLTSPDSDAMDKKRLYLAIRKLEAENYSLKKQLLEFQKNERKY